MKSSLGHIISNCIKGERAAQKELYEYTYTSLKNIIGLYLKDNTQHDWIFNIAMLKIYNSLPHLAKDSNYLGFARTIIVRTTIDHYRSTINSRLVMVSKEMLEESNYVNPEMNEILNQIQTEDIIHLLYQLPENERMVFNLYELEGYSHKEIETLFGINQNTSKWLLTKARLNMKTKVNLTSYVKDANNGK